MARDEGYTLLEVVIATALLALMAMPLAGSVRLGLAAWSGTYDKATENEHILLAHNRLHDWLQAAYPAYYNRLGGATTYPMEGDEETISFIAPVGADARSDNLYQVSASLNETGTLIVAVRPDFEMDGEWCLDKPEDCISSPLLDGVKSISFSYWDPVQDGWIDSWPAPTVDGDILQRGLPAAVRAVIIFSNPKRVWPPLIVNLEVDEWARCEFQPTELECS